MQTRLRKSLQNCSICYEKVIKRGQLDSCRHMFCYDCINNWSKIENTCPMCKRRFTKIHQKLTRHVYKQAKNAKARAVVIEQKNQSETEQIMNFTIQELTQGLFQIMGIDIELLNAFLNAQDITLNVQLRMQDQQN